MSCFFLLFVHFLFFYFLFPLHLLVDTKCFANLLPYLSSSNPSSVKVISSRCWWPGTSCVYFPLSLDKLKFVNKTEGKHFPNSWMNQDLIDQCAIFALWNLRVLYEYGMREVFQVSHKCDCSWNMTWNYLWAWHKIFPLRTTKDYVKQVPSMLEM